MVDETKHANERQVGGQHYKMPGHEEHWDRVNRLGLDYFQAQITKYTERWKQKGGVNDLRKAQHFLQKYIEIVEEREQFNTPDEDARLFGMQGMNNITGRAHPWTSSDAPYDYMPAEVKNTGYAFFTYEGGTAEWDLFTCKVCRKEVRVGPNENPAEHHTCVPPSDITGGVAG
jgi:hypothetical protein